MKKKSLLNFWLLLLCMIAGAGTAWSQAPVNTSLWEETWTGGTKDETPSDYGFEGTTVWGGATLTYAQSSTNTKLYNETLAGGTSPELLLSKSNQTWTISGIPTGQATEMTLTFLSNKSTFTLSSSTNGITISGSGTSWTISQSSDLENFDLTLKNTGSANARIDNVVLKVKTAGSGGTVLEDNDLALTGAPIALNFDLYNNSTAQVINYTTSSSGAVTIADSEYATFAINETAKTITVTPTAVTPSMQTITVNQAADATYKAGSVTFTVTVTDSTPIPTHTATFSVNGNTTTQEFEEGATIEFPENPSDIYGKKFRGWVAEAIDGTTDEEPSFVTSATMSTSDVTYYAVFATLTPGIQTEVTDVLTSTTFGSPSSYGDWSGKSATDGSSAVYAGNSTTNNAGSIQIRTTNSNSGIVSTTSGGKVSKVVLIWDQSTVNGRVLNVYGSNTAYSQASDLYNNTKQGTLLCTSTKANEAIDTEHELDIEGDYEYIGFRSADGAMYIKSLSVTWLTGTPDTYSEYCTTVVAAAVEKPVITVAENPFLFSTTATITCETEGAAIKYSYDGENWSDYTAPLAITATTTIYAKATKNEDESKVVSVTATKNLAVPTVTIDATGITNTNVFEGTEAGSLSASVTYNDAAVEGAVVSWSGNNDEVATIDPNTGAVTLVGAGSVTFTATFAANSDYSEKTATYEMTVTNSDPNAPGTENNPYTVAQARAAIDAGDGITDVYATGVVSSIATAFSSQHNNISYYISADGLTTSDQLQIYRGSCSSEDEIRVGDVVVVKGNLTKYGSIYEFAAGSTLQSLKLVAPTFSEEAGAVLTGTEVTIADLHTDATIYYTTDGTEPTAESTEYTSAITINSTTTIKAIAVKDGYTNSDVVTAEYTIAAQAATPTFSPAAGTYTSIQNVTISTETEDATIYYTIDGTTPTEESTVYTDVITVAETMTIKAIAVKDGMVNSEVAEAAYTINVPSILVEETSINASAAENDGTIEVTYNFIAPDPEIVWYTDNTCAETTTEPDWISAGFDASNNIEYVIDANTGEARVAYLKVYGLDDETNDVYSALITISQAEYVAPTTYTLATSITPGKHYLIGNGNVVMGSQNTNNRAAVTVTAKGDVLEVAQDDEVAEFVIYGPNVNGYYTIYDTEAEGYLYAASSSSNYLRTQGTNDANGKWSISIDGEGVASIVAKGSNSRNVMQYNSGSSIFSCYGSASQKDVYLYEKDGEATPTVDVTLATSGYASYCSPLALDLTPTEDYAAWAVTDATSSTVTFTKITGAVPAETPFILYGKEFGGQTATLSVATGETTAVSNNMLVGTLQPTDVTTENGDYTNFALSGGKFVKMSNGTVPANKAYLPILTSVISSSSRLSIVFNDETTGISEVKEVTNVRGEYYNLNGQRVENLKKGNLYIVNGKKILVK